MINDKTQSRSADDISKLLERQRSEYFVLNLDKLWYLETHDLHIITFLTTKNPSGPFGWLGRVYDHYTLLILEVNQPFSC